MNMENVLAQLKKNRFAPYYLETKEQVVPLLRELLPAGGSVGAGGSMTLREAGVMALLRSGAYRFYDRERPGITPDEIRQVYLDSLGADAYLCSANAVTENGELVNVDGNSNRIAAICYGPKSVIIVAGINKIVATAEEGLRRIKTTAAPQNANRLSCRTYCREAGVCMGLEGGITAGCGSTERICCNYLVSGPQRVPGRIKVILVGEELGY